MAKKLVYESSETALDETKIADIQKSIDGFYEAINDDLNTAVAIAEMFNLLKYINMLNTGQLAYATLGEKTFQNLTNNFILFIEEILGLKEEKPEGEQVLLGMLELYKEYKANQQYDKVDQIRNYFKSQGLAIRDLKTKLDWAYNE
jgi:cysteinyl-tRNA synthetase